MLRRFHRGPKAEGRDRFAGLGTDRSQFEARELPGQLANRTGMKVLDSGTARERNPVGAIFEEFGRGSVSIFGLGNSL